MTKEEKKLILDFSLKKITKDEFLERYPLDLNEVKVRELRLDFDTKKGAHINWKLGKQKGSVQFNSSQEQVDRMIKNEIIKSEKSTPKSTEGDNATQGNDN
jgi:hypothetical protein